MLVVSVIVIRLKLSSLTGILLLKARRGTGSENRKMERLLQAKLNETSITDEPGRSSDALSADHLDG